MFKQYFVILLLCFCPILNYAQINSFTVISSTDIKTLSNKIQDRKNEGLTYRILDSLAKAPQYPNWAKAANGDIYKTAIVGNALYFTSSKDGGNTWTNNSLIDSLPNNKKNSFIQVNRCAYIACNKSMNRIYVCWCDAKFGLNNNDLFLTYSDDGGKTWLDRILITYYPNHKQQFMPRFAIDPVNGYLYFMYCSQRNFPKGDLTDVYLSVSRDNGKTFFEYKLNDTAFTWKNNFYLDKYFCLYIQNNNIYPYWTQTGPSKKLIIHSTILNEQILGEAAYTDKIMLDKNITYTYSPKLNINFNGNPGPHSVYLYKANDPKFEVLVSPPSKTGARGFSIDFDKLKLPKATYVAMVYNKDGANYVWIQEE